VSPRLWLKRAQERICLAARQVSSKRAEACRVFALERVLHAAAVAFGGERSWSSAAVNRSMIFIGPPHLGQRQDGEEFVAPEGCDSTCGCGVAEQVKAKWRELGAFAVGQEAEITDAHKTFGKDVQ
jgi:hypothetical protein